MPQIGVSFFLRTSRAVCYRMIDRKKGLEFAFYYLMRKRPWKALDFHWLVVQELWYTEVRECCGSGQVTGQSCCQRKLCVVNFISGAFRVSTMTSLPHPGRLCFCRHQSLSTGVHRIKSLRFLMTQKVLKPLCMMALRHRVWPCFWFQKVGHQARGAGKWVGMGCYLSSFLLVKHLCRRRCELFLHYFYTVNQVTVRASSL